MANERKSEFLGVPYSAASQRLRKMILFRLVQETGRDICFRCGEKIESIDDLSIEHKEPWMNRSVELFWNLENIAFSHLACNVPHSRNGGGKSNIKYDEHGDIWCSGCQSYVPKNKWNKGNKSNGLQTYCRACHNSQVREYKKVKRAKSKIEYSA